MDQALIDNWNSTVGPNDLVYNLGDLCMPRRQKKNNKDYYKDYCADVISNLNGRHVLVLGNHDYLSPFEYVEIGIESVHTSLVVNDIVLAHDPAIATAIPSGYKMFCGHVHDLFKKLVEPTKVLNVGVDIWDYKPVLWREADTYLISGVSSDYLFEDLDKFRRREK